MTDPYRLLGVSTDADDESVRAAYIAAIRASPPERDPRRFKQIRAAYVAIATARDRASHALFDIGVPAAGDWLYVNGTSNASATSNASRLKIGGELTNPTTGVTL